MSFGLGQLFAIGIAYLLVLFGIAHTADRGWIPERIIRHPITYVLSLGVFASAWAIYGVVSLAHNYGFGFLAYYLGIASTFVFAPLLLLPLLRITRSNMHSSLADVLAYRFHSQWAGSLVTICMVLAVWPLLALQIQAVADSLQILSTVDNNLYAMGTRQNDLAFIFCIAISLFAISFGSKHLTAHERHNGLVAAIAFESIVKLLAMLVVGAVAIYQVFGGFDGLDRWLLDNPTIVSLLNDPQREDSSRSLLLIFFSAAVAMPHLFHMIFAENPNPRALLVASWGMPLFLLLMSLPILPILWAGFKLDTAIPSEYFTLAVGLELGSPVLTILIYVGGLSAASGAVIVTTLALASMCLKHLVLPLYRPSVDRDIYRWLLWIRRLLIVLIILTGYTFFRFIAGRETLSSLGLAAFIATLQFLPGVLAALYWQGANRNGFIAGLIAGFAVWFITLLLPIISDFDPYFIDSFYLGLQSDEMWSAIALISVGINTLVFAVVSALTTQSDEERMAAEVCSTDDLNRPTRLRLRVKNPMQMKEQLATALGVRTAQREVDRALTELNLPTNESRPFALRRLRYRLEANLSGLLGPSVANDMIKKLFTDDPGEGVTNEDINLIEGQLEHYKTHLTGLAADLDNLRRYHRQTLQDLPVGVCSLGLDGEILMWNRSIEEFTGIRTFEVIGSNLRNLPKPWGELLSKFLVAPQPHWYKQFVEIGGSKLWFNLHKTSQDISGEGVDGRVIVLEDATEVQLLENELVHSERLASIGRLAAGVAHEIGNPVTGIACLAQNLRYETENLEVLDAAREILVQTDRVSKIVQSLVNFSHSGSDKAGRKLEPVHIKTCADEAIHLLQLNKDAKYIDFTNRCAESCYAVGDTQRLLQVFINLLSNARDASPEGSPVFIDCDTSDKFVLVHVTDRGTGISKELQEQIFDPFFTTKDAGKGTGLGLSLAYGIMEDLGGSISVESPADPGYGGTRFTLRLNLLPSANHG